MLRRQQSQWDCFDTGHLVINKKVINRKVINRKGKGGQAGSLCGIYVWWQSGNLWEAETKGKPEREMEMVEKHLCVWKPLRRLVMLHVPVPPASWFAFRRCLQFLFQWTISCLIGAGSPWTRSYLQQFLLKFSLDSPQAFQVPGFPLVRNGKALTRY